MSWQVRLGNLDKEIEEFLENNPDFPVTNKREFVKYAVRDTMRRYVTDKNKDFKAKEEKADEEVKEELS